MENQTPTSEQEPQFSIAEAMRTAAISDQTRDYLILSGKLMDLHGAFSSLIERDYGDSQVDSITEKFSDTVEKARSEVERYLMFSINENMGNVNTTTI